MRGSGRSDLNNEGLGVGEQILILRRSEMGGAGQWAG